MNDLCFAGGCGLFMYGLYVIYPPVAMIAGGLSIMYLAVSWGTPKPKGSD